AQVMFAIERERKMLGVPRENGGAIQERPAKRQEMSEHQPAAFPPRLRAEDAAVKIHRGRHVRGDEREVNHGSDQQRVSEPQSQQAQGRDEKPNAPAPAAKSAGARPMNGLG